MVTIRVAMHRESRTLFFSQKTVRAVLSIGHGHHTAIKNSQSTIREVKGSEISAGPGIHTESSRPLGGIGVYIAVVSTDTYVSSTTCPF